MSWVTVRLEHEGERTRLTLEHIVHASDVDEHWAQFGPGAVGVGWDLTLHAVADLEDVDAERVFTEATARNIEVMPLSAYYYGGGERSNALLLGFGACRPAAIRAGMWRLAAAIDAARRSQ